MSADTVDIFLPLELRFEKQCLLFYKEVYLQTYCILSK